MSKSLWITPEEALRKKKMKKNILYVSIMLGTIVFSTLLTLLVNNL
ncbi:hypothetical protein [Neobacillus sp. DY30]|nr:hypothetical protein [Neobacillus sp. DY30]WHX99971.1 hypothetical protein QNH29_25990 [Neobacillus sp. DY30]